MSDQNKNNNEWQQPARRFDGRGVERLFSWVQNNQRQVALLVSAGLLVAGLGYGYVTYQDHQNQQAHQAYEKARALMDKRVSADPTERKNVFEQNFTSEEQKWEAVSLEFGRVAKRYGHTSTGALAGVRQAQALIKLGRNDEARKTYKEYVHKLPSSAAKELYQLNLALLLIDANTDAERAEGKKQLEAIAGNSSSAVHDTALYRLGEYYWHQNKYVEARGYWQDLIRRYGSGQDRSHWVDRAEQTLSLFPL